MSRKVATKRKATKKTSPAKRARKSEAVAKPAAARSAPKRKRTKTKRSGAASSAAIGLVSGSEFIARAPISPSKNRKERKGVTVYMDPAQKEILDQIGRQKSMTLQDLGLEAFELLFEKYGKTPGR